MDISAILSRKMEMKDVSLIVGWVSEDPSHRAVLWNHTLSEERKTAVNALWVMTHLPESDGDWISSLRDDLADRLIAETDISKKRLLLQMLKKQTFEPEHIRTDLLDYCLSKINSECEPYAVRCFSLYVAYNMCRHYPELIAELEGYLDMLASQSLSPGLKSALRQTRSKINRLSSQLRR